MQFLKKHYEKVVLSVVLLGLAAAAAALPMLVGQVRDQIDGTVSSVIRSKPKPWVSADLAKEQALVRRLDGPVDVRLSGEHNLFNPVRWVKSPRGGLIKVATGNEIGPGAVVVTKISPLNLTVSLEGVSTNSDRTQYTLSVHRENARGTARPKTGSAPVGVRNVLFTINKIEGSPEAPTALEVQLADDTEPIIVRRDKPYTRVVGYAADLIYPPEKQNFPRKEEGEKLKLEGEPEMYKISVIDENEVTLSAEKSGKRTTVRLNPAAAMKN